MARHFSPGPQADATTRGFFGVFRYGRRAMGLVWTTNRRLTVALAVLTLIAGVLPAAMAYVGALIIDAVLDATKIARDTGVIDMVKVFTLVAIEALIVAAIGRGAAWYFAMPGIVARAAGTACERDDP